MHLSVRRNSILVSNENQFVGVTQDYLVTKYLPEEKRALALKSGD